MCFHNINIASLILWILFIITLHVIFRVEEEPSGARTWVASSGTENSVFSWSVWRRLPLHEVRASFRVLLCALSIL